MTAPTPTQSDTMTVLRAFLLNIMPDGVEIIQAQDNRVPEPRVVDFITMTPIRRARLATNIDSWADVRVVGSIFGATLTVTDVSFGVLAVGQTVFGTGVVLNTKITALAGGTGGSGLYTVSPSQIAPSQVISAGQTQAMQETEVTVQLDVHGPSAGDNAQVISTLLRDDYAVRFFLALSPFIAPLYADDPRQMPFVNENQQVENRWVVDAHLQANPSVPIPQQYMDVVSVEIISVDERYPP